MISGTGPGFQLINRPERGILGIIRAARLYRTCAGQRRVDVAGINELAALTANVTSLQQRSFPQTLLHIDVHVLHIRRAQFLIHRKNTKYGDAGTGPGIDSGLENQACRRTQ